MDVFSEIRATYRRHVEAGLLDQALSAWREEQPVLAVFESFADLERLCRECSEERYEERDRILAALCDLSEKDEAAKLALCGLFLPGLLESAQVLSANASLPIEELHAELLAHFWAAVRRLPPDVDRVAQRIVNSARWRTRRSLERAARHLARVTPTTAIDQLPEAEVGDGLWHAAAEAAVEASGIAEILSEAVAQGVVSDAGADLATASRRRFPEVCERHGLDEETARALCRAAKERLRAWVAQRQAE